MSEFFMDEFKKRFIEFAFANGLKVFDNPDDDRVLKSKRVSPWFLNVGEFNDGATLDRLSQAYAEAIINSGVQVDLLYGIPEKGVGLVGPVASHMARSGHNAGWFFTRKMPKEHGEATGLDKSDLTKLVVGRVPKCGESIGQLDDVFTAGDAKYMARAELEALGEFKLPLLAIALDRQEVGLDGNSAIFDYQNKTGTKVVSVINALDVLDYMKYQISSGSANSDILSRRIERLSNYLRVYGTQPARKSVGALEHTIIPRDRSVIPACDVETLEQFEELVRQTADLQGIGGYKIGFELGYGFGLPAVVNAARMHTDKPIIFDHQKAATDIPDTGRSFAKVMSKSGVDAVILFPQAGPETERAWIYEALDKGLKVIVGGRMTHPCYSVSEGGFIADDGALEMYRIAARAGVNNFVVPGNKPEVIKQVRELVESEGITSPIFYAPGFVIQGGVISDSAKTAGKRFHGIVGRGIYKNVNMRAAAIEHCSQLD